MLRGPRPGGTCDLNPSRLVKLSQTKEYLCDKTND
jgi:hypothetical protein